MLVSSTTLKYIGGMTTELFLTGPSGKEYVQKPGEDLTVADEDVNYFIGLGAWEMADSSRLGRTSSPETEVKGAIPTETPESDPFSDTPAG